MEIIKPKKLKPGDTIALIAPSSWCEPESSAGAAEQLEKMGYKAYIHPQCLARDNMSAGTTEEKVAALHDVFSDPNIDAVFCLRGGYRAIHMLDKIDYTLIRNNPKIFLGYSDITALHSALFTRAGLVTFHGPTANGLRDFTDPSLVQAHDTFNAALDFLGGNTQGNLFRQNVPVILHRGETEGVLWGGNIQLLSALFQAGDSYHPSLNKAILVIEDINEEIAKMDTQLGGWRLRGHFQHLAGLVVGGLTDIKDTPGRAGPFVHSFEEIIRQHTQGFTGPIVTRAPFGHQHPNYIFPQGCRARLKADKKGDVTLSLAESPFSD